jgi:general stress protein YciG
LIVSKKVPKEASEYLSKIGRKGGKARLKTMSPEARKKVAAMGARARWKAALPQEVSEYMSKIGKKGGKARLKTMSPATRKKIAAMGGRAKAKPTACRKCGQVLPTARAAWVHCAGKSL